MPRPESTPLRWVEEAEARPVLERAVLVHHDAEARLQIQANFSVQPEPWTLSFLAAILSMLLTAPSERPAEREQRWHDGVI